MPELTEVLMGAGEARVPFFRDRELEAELVRRRHLVFYWGEELIGMVIILGRDPSAAGYEIVGRFLPWWLGTDSESTPALIEHTRYRAGHNRLDNGDLELGETQWSIGQDSKWRRHAEARESSDGAYMRMEGDPAEGRDDQLMHEGRWDDIEPGDEFELSCRALFDGSAAATGTWLRLQAIFTGRFKHPNLETDGFVDDAAWLFTEGPSFEIVQSTPDAYEGSHALRIGPIPKRSFVQNGGFEDGFDHWNENSENTEVNNTGDGPFKGSLRMVCLAGGLDTPGASQDLDGVQPEDELYVTIHTNSSSRSLDEQFIARFSYDDEDSDLNFDDAIVVSARSSEDWRKYTARYNVPRNYDPTTFFRFFVGCDEVISSGAWAADEVSVIRTRGNIEYIRWLDRDGGFDSMPIVPGRRYRVRCKIRSEADVKGEVWLVAALLRHPSAPQTEFEYIESARRGPTKERWATLEFEFEAPSNFSRLILHIFAQDVFGGSFWMDALEVVDADETTWVEDAGFAHTLVDDDWTALSHPFEVPEGARDMHVQVVAGEDGGGFNVDDLELRWTGPQSIAQTPDIVAELVVGTGLSVGKAYDAGPLLFDWEIRNDTRMNALMDLSRSGLVLPAREWYVDHDGNLVWGLPEELFTDREDVVFVEDDDVVLGLPDVAFSDENFVSRVKLIGQERTSFRGNPYVITAEASNAVPDDALLFDGSPFSRDLIVEDSGADSKAYATELATTHAQERATELRAYTLEISDWRTLGRFNVGDWIYVYAPTEAVEDEANERDHDGRTIYPERIRATSRRWTLGSGPFRCVLRRGPGDEIDVTDKVQWATATSASLEIGDVVPEFLSNPQGGSEGTQFLRHRRRVREA